MIYSRLVRPFALVAGLLPILVLLVSCGRPDPYPFELAGTEQERIERLELILSNNLSPLPSPILDPQLYEGRVGNGMIGPSDFWSFGQFQVLPAELDGWVGVLGPRLERSPETHAQDQPDWWSMPDSLMNELELYQSKVLTGRVNGWVGIHRPTAKIYFHSFTM